MKSVLVKLFVIILISNLNIFPQEEELDKLPFPVGGIEQIAKNVVYPLSAKENNLQGEVFIKAVIDPNGNVSSTEIIKSLDTECDNAAAEAIKKTKFTPGIKDGKAVESQVTIPIKFKLG
jgi:TonB family protein